MNHPDQSTWVAYLYNDDLSPAERHNLEAHLRDCPACRARFHSWQQVGRSLSSLPNPTPLPLPPRTHSAPSWIAAAAALVALGIAIGHYLLPNTQNLAAIRAELRAELAAIPTNTNTVTTDNLQRLLATYATAQAESRDADLRAVYTALNQLERQRVSDYASLRQDMETVAVLTDASFRRTSQKLVQLASYQTPDNSQ